MWQINYAINTIIYKSNIQIYYKYAVEMGIKSQKYYKIQTLFPRDLGILFIERFTVTITTVPKGFITYVQLVSA